MTTSPYRYDNAVSVDARPFVDNGVLIMNSI